MDDRMKVSTSAFTLTDHAKERIRQRIGITAEGAAIAWVSAKVESASKTKRDGRKTHYITEAFEIVCEGLKVVTVMPTDITNRYLTKLGDVITKEVTKLIAEHNKELRKADIAIAEAQLNFLKARNPRTKEVIQAKLVSACDCKVLIEDEIKMIRKAAGRYGVE